MQTNYQSQRTNSQPEEDAERGRRDQADRGVLEGTVGRLEGEVARLQEGIKDRDSKYGQLER